MTSIPTLSLSRHFLTPVVLDSQPSPARITRILPRVSADPNSGETAADDEAAEPAGDSEFENRLAQVRVKYRSGSGKKAEQRRSKKSAGGAAAAKKGGPVMLPPVPLREPIAAGGMKVELGFTPYSEHVNGRLAALGLAALILVELGSGKGLFSFHAPATVFIQIYTVTAVSAMFVKFEKERISVWPTVRRSSGGE